MKKFLGFTPKQQYQLLKSMGYDGPDREDSMDQFIASSPSVAARMGKYADIARRKLSGISGFAEGGLTTGQAKQNLDDAQAQLAAVQGGDEEAMAEAQKNLQDASAAFNTVGVPTTGEIAQESIDSPTNLVTPQNVAQIQESNDQLIAAGTGQQAPTQQVDASQVGQAQTATAAPREGASTYEATTAGEGVDGILEGAQAATAQPSEKATVRGQLELLMEDFQDGTPPWAAGAMREATAIMQRRGMGASSAAGKAIVQAAMEAALPIAGADARTQAEFEMQNLNNEQQMTIFKTQQRIASLFTDQAQENAAKQFNAASENQTKQFFADLETTVSRFNAEQINAIRQFDTDQDNTIKRFNSQLEAARDQFNATNNLVIAQANAQWRQDIATANTAAQNIANMEQAKQANQLTQKALDEIWQRERDIMSFAFASSESKLDRDLQLLLANKTIRAEQNAATTAALGYLVGRLFF